MINNGTYFINWFISYKFSNKWKFAGFTNSIVFYINNVNFCLYKFWYSNNKSSFLIKVNENSLLENFFSL